MSGCVQSKARHKSSYRTRYSGTPASRRSLAFSSPVATSSAVSLQPSVSPAHAAPTDRALTFLQSARDRGVPVRSGKWSPEEDAYLTQLLALFRDGLLADVSSKTSLRSWLAQMLNCCPMRISKKQMHGHSFSGKSKYQRSSRNVERLTQRHFDQLSSDVHRLRADFLRAWAGEEHGRRGARLVDAAFQDWHDRVLRLVPTPTIARHAGLAESKKKRLMEPLELTLETQQDAKRHKVSTRGNVRAEVVAEKQQQQEPERDTSQMTEMGDTVDLVLLEPASLPAPAPALASDLASTSTVTALPVAYCSESVRMGDWLTSSARCTANWNEPRSWNHANEACYTICEDEVQLSLHLGNIQTATAELSMTRKSSRLVIDFGAPSCWHTGEEPKRTSFVDYSHWTDNDLADELTTLMEPGIFGWDDASPISHVTYSPTLNLM